MSLIELPKEKRKSRAPVTNLIRRIKIDAEKERKKLDISILIFHIIFSSLRNSLIVQIRNNLFNKFSRTSFIDAPTVIKRDAQPAGIYEVGNITDYSEAGKMTRLITRIKNWSHYNYDVDQDLKISVDGPFEKVSSEKSTWLSKIKCSFINFRNRWVNRPVCRWIVAIIVLDYSVH